MLLLVSLLSQFQERRKRQGSASNHFSPFRKHLTMVQADGATFHQAMLNVAHNHVGFRTNCAPNDESRHMWIDNCSTCLENGVLRERREIGFLGEDTNKLVFGRDAHCCGVLEDPASVDVTSFPLVVGDRRSPEILHNFMGEALRQIDTSKTDIVSQLLISAFQTHLNVLAMMQEVCPDDHVKLGFGLDDQGQIKDLRTVLLVFFFSALWNHASIVDDVLLLHKVNCGFFVLDRKALNASKLEAPTQFLQEATCRVALHEIRGLRVRHFVAVQELLVHWFAAHVRKNVQEDEKFHWLDCESKMCMELTGSINESHVIHMPVGRRHFYKMEDAPIVENIPDHCGEHIREIAVAARRTWVRHLARFQGFIQRAKTKREEERRAMSKEMREKDDTHNQALKKEHDEFNKGFVRIVEFQSDVARDVTTRNERSDRKRRPPIEPENSEEHAMLECKRARRIEELQMIQLEAEQDEDLGED